MPFRSMICARRPGAKAAASARTASGIRFLSEEDLCSSGEEEFIGVVRGIVEWDVCTIRYAAT